jgi:hypothetical protein
MPYVIYVNDGLHDRNIKTKARAKKIARSEAKKKGVSRVSVYSYAEGREATSKTMVFRYDSVRGVSVNK